MKKFRYFALLTLMAFTLSFVSCSEDSPSSSNDDNTNITPGTLSFILDGGDYSNQKFEFSISTGFYSPDDDKTYLNFLNSDQSQSVVITFQGNKTGTFEISENNGIIITLGEDGYIALTSGSIKVTSYGGVSSYISGTFSGVAISPTNPNINVKDGKFSALRVIF